MKKILIILSLTLAVSFYSCENQNVDFPDYNYTAGYFPYQFPVRTLVLGDYIYPNENDNNHKFLIYAAIGGVYENKAERILDIELAPELCNNVKFSAAGDPIQILPSEYYSLSSSSKLIIPEGQVNGYIEVQLTDAFFDDPLAIKLGYVVPIRITGAQNLDTILRGKTIKANPDPRITTDWTIVPKDYTMFAVKYINEYHGKYLHRGTAVTRDASSAVLDRQVYHNKYAEKNEIWSLVTTGKNSVTVSGNIRSSVIIGTLSMDLTFAGDNNCTIVQSATSPYTITGTGRFANGEEEWGGKKRDAIFISYQLTDGTNTYSATDTLAMRDRAVVLEVYKPVVSLTK